MKIWGILLFGLIGATATTFAVGQLRRTVDWFYNQKDGYLVISDCEGPNIRSNEDDLCYTLTSSLPKLQFRSDFSKAKWNKDLGLAEVVEKKGKMWVSTGFALLRRPCGYLAEIGALLLVDDGETVFTLEDVYGKVAGGKSGCCWERYEAYGHLKSLGYVVGLHGVPWSVKGVSQNQAVSPVGGTKGKEVELDTLLEEMLKNLQVDEIRPVFDVYLPNSKFKKSSPGDPVFILCLIRGSPPLRAQVEALERQCGDVPLKFCHVDHGRVSFLSFEKVELPVLP